MGREIALCKGIDNRGDRMIKDSGDRREFTSGAVRDMAEGKGRCDLLPLDVLAEHYTRIGLHETAHIFIAIHEYQQSGNTDSLYDILKNNILFPSQETMILELAKHFEEGSKKYSENNWKLGINTKYYIDSGTRHYLKWLRGDNDEPHDRAFCWNILCCIWTCVHKPELNSYRKASENEK